LKKEIEKFKEGDLVRVVDVGTFQNIILNNLYIIDRVNGNIIYLKVEFNNPISGGWFPRRFKKVFAKDMTEEEKSKYINYKLGIKQ